MPASQSVTIGGRAFALSPLDVGAVRRHRAEFVRMLSFGTRFSPTRDLFPESEDIAAVGALLFESAKVLDPTLTEAAVMAHIDALPMGVQSLTEIAGAYGKLMELSGFGASSTGEPTPGEAASPLSST